jgi:TonB family protein
MEYSPLQPGQFSLLPKAQVPWNEFALSTGVQACAIAILVSIRVLHPGIVSTPEHTFRAVRLVSAPKVAVHKAQPLHEAPKTVYVAQVDPPAQALRLSAPQPRIADRVAESPAPKVLIAASKLEPMPANTAPVFPKVVATNLFSSGSSAPPTTSRDAVHVQTGGFGDPNGVPAKANTGKAVNIAAAGSFDLPSGGGDGNGSGGKHGVPGVVASSGFGNGVVIAEAGVRGAATGVQQGGFGDANSVPSVPIRSRPENTSAPLLAAEIISKPSPVYTQEARSLKIQGEVLLEVVLGASGSLHVVRVVRGLGHGLDDNAVKAAEQIRFRPAMRNGQAADSTVVLHIIFQLA